MRSLKQLQMLAAIVALFPTSRSLGSGTPDLVSAQIQVRIVNWIPDASASPTTAYALLAEARASKVAPVIRVLVPGGEGGFLPFNNSKATDPLERQFTQMSKDGSTCGFVLKNATKNHECGCLVLTKSDSIIFYPRINKAAENLILSTKSGKAAFGDKLDLSGSRIEAVRTAAIDLYAPVVVGGNHTAIIFSMRLLQDGGMQLSSWHIDQ